MKSILIRAILVYFFTVFSMRTLGKRQIGQMQMSELVTAFFLSELATYAVTENDSPVFYGLVPILAIILIEYLISFFTLKSGIVKRMFDFSPTVVIREGVVLSENLKKSRVTLDEMMSLLRLEGYFDLGDVRFAFLEPNGSISVVPYESTMYPTKQEMSVSSEENGYTVFVIQDGIVNKKGLDSIGRGEKWLWSEIRKHKGKLPSDFFLLASDLNGNTIAQKFDQTKSASQSSSSS